jgi:hypothetical protein
MAGERENVAIFNPLVLPLPSWHPDGPDGAIDGFVIPFVFPETRASGRKPNRDAKIAVAPTEHGWRASLRNCQDHAETAEQARAFAAAWIRAAELLENVAKADELRDFPQRHLLGADQTPADVEDQDAPIASQTPKSAPPCSSQSFAGRECVRSAGHEEIHMSIGGWTWRRDGDPAFLAGDTEGGDA